MPVGCTPDDLRVQDYPERDGPRAADSVHHPCEEERCVVLLWLVCSAVVTLTCTFLDACAGVGAFFAASLHRSSERATRASPVGVAIAIPRDAFKDIDREPRSRLDALLQPRNLVVSHGRNRDGAVTELTGWSASREMRLVLLPRARMELLVPIRLAKQVCLSVTVVRGFRACGLKLRVCVRLCVCVCVRVAVCYRPRAPRRSRC
jgi:hypothetical protein